MKHFKTTLLWYPTVGKKITNEQKLGEHKPELCNAL